MDEILRVKGIKGVDNHTFNLKNVSVFSGATLSMCHVLSRLVALLRNWEIPGEYYAYENVLAPFGIDRYVNKNTNISYTSPFLTVNFDGKVFVSKSKISRTDEKIRVEEIFKKQVKDILNEALNEGSRNSKPEYLYKRLSQMNILIDNIVLIPANRLVAPLLSETFINKGNNQEKLPLLTSIYMNRFEQAKKALQSINFPDLFFEYKYENA